jgi:hypothetical protein
MPTASSLGKANAFAYTVFSGNGRAEIIKLSRKKAREGTTREQRGDHAGQSTRIASRTAALREVFAPGFGFRVPTKIEGIATPVEHIGYASAWP